jgi:ankyrin repeat protein
LLSFSIVFINNVAKRRNQLLTPPIPIPIQTYFPKSDEHRQFRGRLIATLLNANYPRVDVNYSRLSGHTALFFATVMKDASITKALLTKGADPNQELNERSQTEFIGWTPLHFACMNHNVKQVSRLIEFGADPNHVALDGKLPIDRADDATHSVRVQLGEELKLGSVSTDEL